MVKSPKLLNQIQIHTLHQPRGISIIITIHSILLLNHCEKEIKSKKWGGGRAPLGRGLGLLAPLLQPIQKNHLDFIQNFLSVFL
jgi:hypothetical protein